MKSIHSLWPTIFPICICVIHLVFQIWLFLTANALSTIVALDIYYKNNYL